MPHNTQKSDTRNEILFNHDVSVGEGIHGITSGLYSNGDIIVRIQIPENKSDERYLKKFNCLTPNANLSRLYLIPERELLRQNESKRKAAGSSKKRA